MVFYENKVMVVETPASRDPSMVKVRLVGHGPTAAMVATELINQNNDEAPYEFAGQHGGMPRQIVWAMSRAGTPIDPYVNSVVERVSQVDQHITADRKTFTGLLGE